MPLPNFSGAGKFTEKFAADGCIYPRGEFGLKSDHVLADGIVTAHLKGRLFRVRLDVGRDVLASICGKMDRAKIKVLPGDKVHVRLSPTDLDHGLISYRYVT